MSYCRSCCFRQVKYADDLCYACSIRSRVNDLVPSPPPAAKETNPKDRAATSRLDLSLFPATASAYGALALTEGDLKYGGYNWRSAGVMASVYYAACRRHLDKWLNGEREDPASRVPHLANALACIAILIDATECGKLNDDRPPVCDLARLLTEMEGRVKHLQSLFPSGPPRHRQVPQ